MSLSFANFFPVSNGTARLCSKSFLFPTSATTMASELCALIFCNHPLTFSNDLGFVMSYTKNIPPAPL